MRLSTGRTATQVSCGPEFGILFKVIHENREYTVWIPPVSESLRFDQHHRIAISQAAFSSYQWNFAPEVTLSVSPFHPDVHFAMLPYAVFEDSGGQSFDQLGSLTEIERRLYRKSEWFFAAGPADFWKYLINGSVYDPRVDDKVGKRFKCQQCAFAWWTYFDFLLGQTGKRVYSILRDQAAFSVLADMSSDGEWAHGYWSDEMETHARFHLDGIHLLISQYEKTNEGIWLKAAERGMRFVFDHLTDSLDDGSLWFLHDTIEATRRHHFRSNLFGKASGNSLCLNTHIQALTVLNRLKTLGNDAELYRSAYNKGLASLRRVLLHQPGEYCYKRLNPWIRDHKRRRAGEASGSASFFCRLEGRILQFLYWKAKRRYPRVVHSDGFTDRDLTLTFAPPSYHITNLKDLLTLYAEDQIPWLRPYIVDAFKSAQRFIGRLGLKEAVSSSPYFIEFMDILHMYDRLVSPLSSEQEQKSEELVFEQTHGYSLDYYASQLVRPTHEET